MDSSILEGEVIIILIIRVEILKLPFIKAYSGGEPVLMELQADRGKAVLQGDGDGTGALPLQREEGLPSVFVFTG